VVAVQVVRAESYACSRSDAGKIYPSITLPHDIASLESQPVALTAWDLSNFYEEQAFDSLPVSRVFITDLLCRHLTFIIMELF